MHERDKIVRDEFDYAFIIRWVSNKHYDCVYRRFLKSMVIIDFSKSFPVDQSECLLETHRMITEDGLGSLPDTDTDTDFNFDTNTILYTILE